MVDENTQHPYGFAELTPDRSVVAGSYTTWTITYTVGELGMDDGSTLKIATKVSSDWGPPQFDSPADDNYSQVYTSGDADIRAEYDPRGYQRPWMDTIDINVFGGTLTEGDTITIVLGDTSQGSRGIRAQSFVESFRFRVLVDVFETGQFMDVPGDLTTEIESGDATFLDVVVPSQIEVGDAQSVCMRARDEWGNIATEFSEEVRFEVDGDAVTMPDTKSFVDGVLETSVKINDTGVYRISAKSIISGLETTSNPVVCLSEIGQKTFWGDLHGQSEETVGTGSIWEYFEFARKKGFLDFAAPANHDFQMTDEFWNEIKDAVGENYEPNEFVTFLSYEWSANTPAGGDHNVYFRDDDADLHRISNWMVEDESVGHTNGVYPIEKLYKLYEGRDDVIIIPHQGGRPARIDDLEPELTPFVEILSLWGVFEWFGHEALERGYPIGFVGGSDDTTGRLGANYPSAKDWYNIKGGLMGVTASQLTRDKLWQAFKKRSVYATTGARILVSVDIDGKEMGATVEISGTPQVKVSVHATAPIQRIELFRGTELVDTNEPGGGSDQIELIWTGLHSKNRKKQVDWSGSLRLNRGEIENLTSFGFDDPQQGVEYVNETSATWIGRTSGNYQGVRLEIDAPNDAILSLDTEQMQRQFRVDELQCEQRIDIGDVNKHLTVRPTTKPTELDVNCTLEDKHPPSGMNPYYVRIQQADGEMAWTSPVRVTQQ